jgi:hypothetical protein
MPRIRCQYIDCIFLDDGYCGAAAIEVDPDVGCMTFKRTNDIVVADDWEDEDADELEEWDEIDLDEDDDIWIDEDDDY